MSSVKLSVSLSEGEVEALDKYARVAGAQAIRGYGNSDRHVLYDLKNVRGHHDADLRL